MIKKIRILIFSLLILATIVPLNPVVYALESETKNELLDTEKAPEVLPKTEEVNNESGVSETEKPETANSNEPARSNSAVAQENVKTVTIDKYLFNLETKTIERYLGNDTVVNIPASLTYNQKQYPVEHIGQNAFAFTNPKIEELTLPEGLKSISEGGFKVNALKSVTIPSTLLEIANDAFLGNGLASLNFVDHAQLEKIGENAFLNNKLSMLNLDKLSKLTNIEARAFKNNHLVNIMLPTSLTTIGDEAFFGNNLTEVNIPNNVNNYGDNVFNDNGRLVVVKTESDVIKSQIKLNEFGSIVNPVSFFIKGVDKEGNEILSVREYKNDLSASLALEELLTVGNNIKVTGPKINGYLSEVLTLEPLTKQFIQEHNTKEKPYIFNYSRNESKPVLEGLNPLKVELNKAVDFLSGVSAKTASGQEIPNTKIKYEPNKIDTSYEAIHKVTYTVTDDSGNKTSGIRTIIVGRDIMELETGKGWIMRDFEYEDGSVTGFSEEGLKKLATNRDVVLPNFDPTNLEDVKPITGISDSAFEEKELLSVVLPDTIITIGDNAFKNNKLFSINLPNTLQSIGNYAFKDNSLTDLVLPENISEIKESAFENNKISSIVIPQKLTTLSNSIFKNNRLTQVTLHNKLTSIGDLSFENNKINNVTLPASLTSIGYKSFANNELTTINLHDSITSVGEYAFENNKLNNVVIGKGLTFINNGLFKNNQLSTFTVPENITELKDEAFQANNFTALNIPNHITKIGNSVFRENYLLKQVTFSEGLTSIGDYAFYKVDFEMDELVFPDSLRSIGGNAFNGEATGSNIKKITFNQGLETIGYYAFGNLALNEIYTKNSQELGKLPESITSLASSVFYNNNLKKIIIPNNITEIPEYLASENLLEDIEFSTETTSIGQHAFSKNYLKELDLKTKTPKLIEIGDYAFYKNQNLIKVTTGDSLEIIGSNAFYDNINLREVSLGSGIKTIGSNAFYYNSKLSKINFPQSLETIGDSAFYQNSSLTNIELNQGLQSIGNYAFYETKLSSITIPNTVKKIGSYAFSESQLRDVKLSNSLENIPVGAFYRNHITELLIPNSIKEISDYAFGENELLNINFEENSVLENIRNYAFTTNQLTSVVLPASVNYISEGSFNDNPGDKTTPGLVRVYIKDQNGYVDKDEIKDSHSMVVNKTPITVYHLEQESQRYIKNPQVVFKPIGKKASFVGEENQRYQPATNVATEIDVTEKPDKVELYYKTKSEFSASNIQLDIQFTNNKKDKLGYGLQDDDRSKWIDFLITLNVTDDSVSAFKNAYLELNFDNPNPGNFFIDDIRNKDLNSIISSSDYIQLEEGVRDFFQQAEVIVENEKSAKLRLYFKDGAIKPQQAIGFRFSYSGSEKAPSNSILDLTGALSFGTEESKTPLATNSKQSRIGVRHIRSLPEPKKQGLESVTYDGEGYAITKNGHKYASDMIEPNVEYFIALPKDSKKYRNYDFSSVKVTDELPKYSKWDEKTNSQIDAYPLLDIDKSQNWQYKVGSDNKIIEFIGDDINEISKYPYYLKFPGILSDSQIYNQVFLKEKVGVGNVKVLNGTLEEAKTKFSEPKPQYEKEIPYSKSDSKYTNIYINEEPEFSNPDTKEKGLYKKELEVYKRNHSFFSSYETALLPDADTSKSYSWYYDGSNHDYSDLTYFYAPANSSENGNYYYLSYMPNTEKYLSKDIEFGIELIYKNGSAKNVVYQDVDLDELLQYKSITIPKEIKTAKLKLYTTKDASGEAFFEKTIYNDPYVLTPSQQAQARSYSLELNGELFGTPFTVSRVQMYNTVEFKDSTKPLEIENNYKRELFSSAKLSATVFAQSKGEEQLSAEYKDGFAVTNSQDIIGSFSKERIAAYCPDPFNPDQTEDECSASNSASSTIRMGKRLNFEYKMSATGFLNSEYQDLLLYDKLPQGLDYLDFKVNPEFSNLIEGFNIETSLASDGRIIFKLKADKIRFNKSGEIDTPISKDITIGHLETIANANIENNDYTNLAYLGIKGVDTTDNNVKDSLSSKDDSDLVSAFNDSAYTAVMEGSAGYKVEFPLQVLGELTEKTETSNVWNPFFIKIPQDGKYNYRLRMVNQTTEDKPSYTAFGVLPYTDDYSAVANQKGKYIPRGTYMVGKKEDGSEVKGQVTLSGPIKIADTTKDASYYSVYYSYENPENLSQTLADNLVLNNSLWVEETKVKDWSKVTAFKVVTNKPLLKNSYDDFILPMKAPDNPDYLFDNLPFSEEFLKENNLKNNKISFKFAVGTNPVKPIGEGENNFTKSVFTEGNRVEAILESPRGQIRILKKGFDTKQDLGIAENETYEAFYERLKPLEGASFELYMVAKENIDPDSAIIEVSKKFPELNNLHEEDKLKDLTRIPSLKIIKEPVRVLSNGQLKTVLTTNDQGYALFSGLFKNRDYILREVKQPLGYNSHIADKWTLISKDTFDKDDSVTKLLNTTDFNIELRRLSASISFNKVDINGEPLAHTRFKLVKLDDTSNLEQPQVYNQIGFTNDSGFLKFDNMPLGKYKLIEMGPRGLLQPIEPIIFYTKAQYDENDLIVADKDLSDYHYNLEFKQPIINNKAKLDVYKIGIFDIKTQEIVKNNELTKLNKNSGKVLKDVQLTLTKGSDYTQTHTSDAFGKVTFTDLDINQEYTLTEVAALEDFEKYTKEYKIKVDQHGNVYINGVKNNFDYVVYPNIPKENTNRIDIKKVDDSDTPKPLKDAEFTLYEVLPDSTLKEIETKKTDVNGDLTFKGFGLEAGKSLNKQYVLKETTPPLGYKIQDGEFRFETNDQTFTYLNKTIVNPKIKLVVNKIDGDTNKPLENAQFTLYELVNNEYQEVLKDNQKVMATTNKTGLAIFDYDQFDVSKVYAIKETSAPLGYELKEKMYSFDLKGLSKSATFEGTYEIEVTNTYKKARISVYKYDDATKQPLENVEFKLVNQENKKEYFERTNKDGTLTFTDLDFGTYVLSEKTTNAGYQLSSDEITVTVDNEHRHVQKNISNKRQGINFMIHKLSENKNNLENAKFSLEKSILEDYYFSSAQESYSNKDGIVTFENLEVGYTYRLTELEPDASKPITPNKEIGAVLGFETSKDVYYVTPRLNQAQEIKIYVRKSDESTETILENNTLEFVNKRKGPKLQIVVTKQLDGGKNLNPMPEFKVSLKRGLSSDSMQALDNTTKTLVKQTDGSYAYTYEDLAYDVYDDNKNTWVPYIYEVVEEPVDHFKETITKDTENSTDLIQRFNIVNTYIVPNISISAKKIWENGSENNPQTYLALFRKLASDQEFTLVSDSIKKVEAGTKQESSYSWDHLPKTDQNGSEYIYKVDETDENGTVIDRIDNFVKSLEYDQENKMHIVRNSYSAPNNKSVIVKKVWSNGPSDKTPIYFQLYRKLKDGNQDFEKVTDDQLTNKETALKQMSPGTTQITFTNLASTDINAKEYVYSVKEVDSLGNELVLLNKYNDQNNPETYHKPQYSYDRPSYKYENVDNVLTVTVTNAYIVPKIEVEAQLIWANGPSVKPKTWLTLYRKISQNGNLEKVSDTDQNKYTSEIKTLNNQTVVKTLFKDLDATDINGQKYIYVVKQTDASKNDFTPLHYVSDVDDVKRNPLIITNRYLAPKTDLTFTKVWKDGNYFRPSVSFKLYRHLNGVSEAVPNVLAYNLESLNIKQSGPQNRVSFSFKDIDLYNDQGQKYTFSVVESSLRPVLETDPGTYSVEYDAHTSTITNSFVPKIVTLSLKKLWENTGSQTPKVYFKLYRVLDEKFLDRLAIERENIEEEVILNKDNFVDQSFLSQANLSVPINKIPILNSDTQKEFIIKLKLPYANSEAIAYRYYVKEYDAKTDLEFKHSNYIVEYLADGLTVKNTYNPIFHHSVVINKVLPDTGYTLKNYNLTTISLLLFMALKVYKRKD